jgi:hypothetical protein
VRCCTGISCVRHTAQTGDRNGSVKGEQGAASSIESPSFGDRARDTAASTIGNYPEIWAALTWNVGIGVGRHGQRAVGECLPLPSPLATVRGCIVMALSVSDHAPESGRIGLECPKYATDSMRPIETSSICHRREPMLSATLTWVRPHRNHRPLPSASWGTRDRTYIAAVWCNTTSVVDVNGCDGLRFDRSSTPMGPDGGSLPTLALAVQVNRITGPVMQVRLLPERLVDAIAVP